MNKFIVVILVLITFISCKKEKVNTVDVSKISIQVSIDRFEQKFYNTTVETLPNLKKEYPYLFPQYNADSVWISKINNKEERELFTKTEKVFSNFDVENKQIEDLFKHIKYYNPNFNPPKVITLITNLDYQNKIIYADSLLFVSLDMYLGGNDEVYNEFPYYLKKNFTKTNLVVDVAKAIIETNFTPNNKRYFIDLLINEGKKMYLLNCYLPTVSNAQKMGYTNEEYTWVEENETQIWKYFIEKELLYSTNSQLYARFIADTPFTKFYLDIDKNSPGKIGVWLGWQIVNAYMKNNTVTLQQLLTTNAKELFEKSKYKPKK